MKKILSIFILAVAAFIVAPQASAYSQEMAEFAQLLNANMEDGSSATYDGNDIILSFPSSYFDGDELSMFSEMDDLQSFAPIMVLVLNESMGADNLNMFASLLAMYNTNLVIKLNLPGGSKTITLTPEILSGQY